jgi:hypothetical protein
VQLARQLLLGTPRRAADEEDVALSASGSFCMGAEQGTFPQLFDRNNRWRLLMVITARKALHLREYERAQKRYKRSTPAAAGEPLRVEDVIGTEPTPEFAAQVAEAYQ